MHVVKSVVFSQETRPVLGALLFPFTTPPTVVATTAAPGYFCLK